MSEMVERIARALCQWSGHNPDHLVIPHLLPIGPKGLPMMGAEPVAAWTLFANDARVALTAMREPPRTMLYADGGEDAIDCWRAMIDAALRE